MKLLGIDFGEKHIGCAIADSDGHVATKLPTLEVVSMHDAVSRVGIVVKSEHIDLVVLGLPLSFQFEQTPMCETVRTFANALAAATGVRITFVNEVLSSDLSKQLTHAQKDHSVSAQILLQDYLDKIDERIT